ncbi:MAG TPA: flagellar filament capping protein FliD [Bryobacteraceae bacterium]|nr:flagellar filament capping protein FliD [Bryobacteraceae bacterium]
MSDVMFNGTSRYSADFQSVIERAVSIASLPLVQMQSTSAQLSAESAALTSLSSKVSALNNAVDALESALGGASFTTSVSNGSLVSAAVSDGALEGVFEVEVTRLGSYENWLSAGNGVTDPASTTRNIAAGTTFQLTVGTATYSLQNITSLNALVNAINDVAGTEVQASALNVHSLAGDDYRLSIQARKLGDKTISLTAGGPDLLTTEVTPGATATYKINKASAESDTRDVTVAPGVTVTLLAQSDPGETASITVSRSSSAILGALNTLASAYNAVVDELDKHRGEAEGALAGQSILHTISDALRRLSTFTDAGQSASHFGIEMTDDGKMSINSGTFTSSTSAGLDGLVDWLGSTGEGGFLQNAADSLNMLEDGEDGVLTLSIENAQASVTAQEARVTAEQERIDKLTESLQQQFSAADALIASLEQQATYFTNLFEAMRTASESLR